MIDIIVPIYNEEKCIPELYRRLQALDDKFGKNFLNIIFVNDGSFDGTLDILNEISKKNTNVQVINFTENLGQQAAIEAGLNNSTSDYAVIIDADLQDPPEIIFDMYEKAKQGYNVIYAQRKARKAEGFIKKFTAFAFYRLFNMIANYKIPVDVGDFRLISKNVVEKLKNIKEKNKVYRVLIPSLGFESSQIYYEREQRYGGETHYTYKKMFSLAKDAFLFLLKQRKIKSDK